jgi:hypothetical protein
VNRNPRELFDKNCPAFPPDQPGSTPQFPYPGFRNGSCQLRSRNEVIVSGSVFAGMGFDVTLPVASYQFHLRPSLNWFAQNMRAESESTRSTVADGAPITCRANRKTWSGIHCYDRTVNSANTNQNDRYTLSYDQTDTFRSRSDKAWMHGLGPRLEFDIEVAKVGNMVFEFFGQVGIYWILTDRTLDYMGFGTTGNGTCTQVLSNNLQGLTVLTDDNGTTYPIPNFCGPTVVGTTPMTGSYTNKAGPYVVQGGGGFRVVWRGLSL